MTYAAFLRAINLGAKNRIRMADLCTLVEDLGYADVRTYLQTGNVVFDAPRIKAATIATKLEQALAASGLQVDVMVRTKRELQALILAEPLGAYNPRAYYQYVVFTKTRVDPPSEPLEVRGVTFLPSPRCALVAVSSKRGGRSANANSVAESHWKVRATTRWWNVVEDFTQDVLTGAR
jgi:uncharacterized protein (DUF1697 family)